ncbi:hypothetical protein NADFUDRAFT_52800 [Nadsonia fulvescens var. elongata DSM 6958]|uniref:Uncharacterized protein n=1 Tax=Nadsonia fulvescens var. elongata DSM 6958 TaxID=857566 RepID=A0A1E3PEG0_9ASCO|nr:hypothetical protein NADFUDRAFT_52800 [Nadsonia fulvescens var. elongata DSM 6958]
MFKAISLIRSVRLVSPIFVACGTKSTVNAVGRPLRFYTTPKGQDLDTKTDPNNKTSPREPIKADIAVDPVTLAAFFESEFFAKIQSTPAAIAQIHALIEYGIAQGYVDPAGKSLGLVKLFKLMRDQEFKKQIAELRAILHKDGISLTPEDTTSLLTLFGKK